MSPRRRPPWPDARRPRLDPCEQGPEMTGEPMAEHELSITRRIEAPPPGRLPRLDRADGRMVGAPPVHDPGGRTRSQARRSRLDGDGGAGRNRDAERGRVPGDRAGQE